MNSKYRRRLRSYSNKSHIYFTCGPKTGISPGDRKNMTILFTHDLHDHLRS